MLYMLVLIPQYGSRHKAKRNTIMHYKKNKNKIKADPHPFSTNTNCPQWQCGGLVCTFFPHIFKLPPPMTNNIKQTMLKSFPVHSHFGDAWLPGILVLFILSSQLTRRPFLSEWRSNSNEIRAHTGWQTLYYPLRIGPNLITLIWSPLEAQSLATTCTRCGRCVRRWTCDTDKCLLYWIFHYSRVDWLVMLSVCTCVSEYFHCDKLDRAYLFSWCMW